MEKREKERKELDVAEKKAEEEKGNGSQRKCHDQSSNLRYTKKRKQKKLINPLLRPQ